MGRLRNAFWVAAPWAFAVLLAGSAAAQDNAPKKKAKGGKQPDPADMGMDGKAQADEAMPAKGKPNAPPGKAAKTGKAKTEADPDDNAENDPAYAKKLANLKKDIEKQFGRTKKPQVFVYTLVERRAELEAVPANSKFNVAAAASFELVFERVCKLSKNREEAVEDAYKFVSAYPNFERKGVKKEKPKKGGLNVGAPPKPQREFTLVGTFPATTLGEGQAAEAMERKQREFLNLEHAEKAAQIEKKRNRG